MNRIKQIGKKKYLIFPLLALLPALILFSIATHQYISKGESSFIPVSNRPSAQRLPPVHSKIKFLVLVYDPEENGQSFAETNFSWIWNGLTTKKQFMEYQKRIVKAEYRKIGVDVTFDSRVINVKQAYPYPDGFKYDLQSYSECFSDPIKKEQCNNRYPSFDWKRFLEANRVCQFMKSRKADELFVFSSPYLMAWEAFLMGPSKDGYWVNGPTYQVQGCNKFYAMTGLSFERPEIPLHGFAHRVEATLRYITNHWSDKEKEKYFQKFTQFDALYNGNQIISSRTTFCGNVHFPHNTTVEYDYSNKIAKKSNCKDWLNFPDQKGTTEFFSCQRWGCNDEGWQTFWMSHIPRSSGTVQMKSRYGRDFTMERNWWKYVLDPNKTIELARSMKAIDEFNPYFLDCKPNCKIQDFDFQCRNGSLCTPIKNTTKRENRVLPKGRDLSR